MTEEEKEICKKFSARDKEGKVHCFECPLTIDVESCVCKKVVEEEEEMNNEKTRERIGKLFTIYLEQFLSCDSYNETTMAYEAKGAMTALSSILEDEGYKIKCIVVEENER